MPEIKIPETRAETEEKRIAWAEAANAATALYREMLPHCHTVRIAGSIRRRKPAVKDIEIVCVPIVEAGPETIDLFGALQVHNRLYERWAKVQTSVQWIKPSEGEIIPWHVQPEGKYWRGYLPDLCAKVDIFLTTRPQFGLVHFLRTGSAEWNMAVLVHAQRVGVRVADGWVWRYGERIDTPKERDVFRALGLAWVEPCDRLGRDQIRAG